MARASVVFVSSLSHFVGYPGAAMYAASKDGLAQYARSVGIALRATGRHCLTVFPGPMRTPHAEQFAPVGASDRRRMDPNQVAGKILHALARRQVRLVVGRGARIAMVVGVLAPTFTTKIMRRTLFERLRSDAQVRGEVV
ncbi:MAG: SDR family NAD(P)-dependent oxidoreductase [Betaproteobacteria bacterium]|nr:SDR family NAD(P)-dependent oxidoreductase [Betaproteobacteria bacterium]